MRLIVDSTEKFQALGGDSLAAGPGQEARETALTFADLAVADAALAAAGGPAEIWHDKAADKFNVRGRAQTSEESARGLVLQAAGSAVGVAVTALSAVQQRALLAVLLNKAGALNGVGEVLPLGQWAR